MVGRQRLVAMLFLGLGAGYQFLAALARLRLGLVALRGLPPPFALGLIAGGMFCGLSLNIASASSAAVRTIVWRIVLAWKKFQRLEASTWLVSALVCELLPPISEIASEAARTATRRAIFLFELSTWP